MFISPSRLKRINLYNLSHLLSPSLLLSEISGSLGDLGTLLPLLLALSLQGSIDLPSTLLFSGLFNILTGVVFGVPLPVQPMKAIAAASLARASTGGGGGKDGGLGETVAAGVWVALAVLLLGGTGGLKRMMRWVPGAVVRGVQVGAGLSLVVSGGGGMVKPLGWFYSTPEGDDGGGEWLDSRLWAVVAFGGLVVTLGQQQSSTSRRRATMPVPYALVLFLLGLIFAIIRVHLSDSPPFPHPRPETELRTGSWTYNPLAHLHFRAVIHSLLTPSSLSTALAQLPLTTLNSIIAASALASDLFPRSGYPQFYYSEESSSSAMPGAWQEHFNIPDSSTETGEGPVPLTPLSMSISLMNLLSAPFGCMPLCHGSGGLAAQYRFGARSGTSIIFLGSIKFLLGLFFPGSGLLNLLQKFPNAFLGVMVSGAGVELARVGVANTETEEDRMVMLMTAGAILAFRNDGVGFLAGMGMYGGFKAKGLLRGLWERVMREDGQRGWLEDDDGDETDEESALLRR